MSHHSDRGFSLVETVIVIAILSLVGITLAMMIQFFYKSNNYVIQEGTATQSAEHGLFQALQDLREASYGDDGSYPLSAAATSTITFYADVNNSGSVERVRLYLSGKTLYRGITYSTGSPATYTGQPEAIDTIATYVVNDTSVPIFQYYDDTGSLLSGTVNVSKVASVSVTLKIDVDPNRSPSPYTLTGSATLRNLRS